MPPEYSSFSELIIFSKCCILNIEILQETGNNFFFTGTKERHNHKQYFLKINYFEVEIILKLFLKCLAQNTILKTRLKICMKCQNYNI